MRLYHFNNNLPDVTRLTVGNAPRCYSRNEFQSFSAPRLFFYTDAADREAFFHGDPFVVDVADTDILDLTSIDLDVYRDKFGRVDLDMVRRDNPHTFWKYKTGGMTLVVSFEDVDVERKTF